MVRRPHFIHTFRCSSYADDVPECSRLSLTSFLDVFLASIANCTSKENTFTAGVVLLFDIDGYSDISRENLKYTWVHSSDAL